MATSVAFIVGIMLSPRAFALLGNLTGQLGWFLFGLILLSLATHLLTVLTYREIGNVFSSPVKDAEYLKERVGTGPALFLVLGPRLLLTLTASVSILAIAGYVLNEVFLYWFPNLGFSFLLLGALLLLNSLSRTVSEKIQVVLVTLSLLGLSVLILSGLGVPGGSLSEPIDRTSTGIRDLSGSGTVLFLFIGFDLAGFFNRGREKASLSPARTMVWGLMITTLVFLCWGWVAMKWVPLDRLSETTVPHLITARAILGQPGRIVMGVILLAASICSVNGLLLGTSTLVSEMAHQGLLPNVLKRSISRVPLPLLFLVLGIGSLLYLGMAGASELEGFIRGGFCLWLLYYVALHLAVLVKGKFSLSRKHRSHLSSSPWIQILGVVLLLIAFLLQFG